MNPEFTLTFWRASFGLLALQIAAVMAVAAIAHHSSKTASWRRSIWQIALATAGLLTLVEWSGAGHKALDWAGRQLVARRTAAAIKSSPALFRPSLAPETTPVLQPDSALVATSSSSFSSGVVESGSDPLTPPVAAPAQKTEEPPIAPAIWWPAWLWFAGFSALSLRFVLLNSVFFLFRFIRRLPLDADLAARVQTLVPRFALDRGVRVMALRGLTGPVAFGFFRPTIGVPPDYSRDFSPPEQDAMLAHELAHLAAHDPAWSWLADMVSAALWWHPLVWIARRQLRATSETAADEASALLQDGPETLAGCLVNLGAKLASGPVYGGVGVAERGFRSALGQRVERLLKLRPDSWQPPRRWTSVATKSIALTGLLIIALCCGAWVSPQTTQTGNVIGAVWYSLDVSAMSGLFAAQVDLPPPAARKPIQDAPSKRPAGPAFISGVVRLHGTPPPEISVDLSQHELDVRGGKALSTRHYVVGEDFGLANVVVYVKSGLQAHQFTSPTESVVLEARGLEWHPYVTAARVGQKITFRNLDPAMHNLHSTPKLNKEFNSAMPSQNSETTLSFPLPEVFIRIKGDVYPWMFTYVSLFDHPYFAVTDQNGRFRFPQPLPPGTYEIEAQHLKAGAMTQTITAGKGQEQKVDFTLSTAASRLDRTRLNESVKSDSVFYPAPKLKVFQIDEKDLVKTRLGLEKELGTLPELMPLFTNALDQLKIGTFSGDLQGLSETVWSRRPRSMDSSTNSTNRGYVQVYIRGPAGGTTKLASIKSLTVADVALAATSPLPAINERLVYPGTSNVVSNTISTNLAAMDPESLLTRTYKVDPNTFLRALERVSGLEPGAASGNRVVDPKRVDLITTEAIVATNSASRIQELVRQFFVNSGVDLIAPKSLFFNDRNGLLMARATRKDLEIIQQAIEVLNTAPLQLMIEARFAELTESDSNALGFDWFSGIQNLALRTNNLAPSKANELAGTVTGILTGSQFRTLIKALEQRGGVDLLTAPRVTTLSGRRAQVSAMQLKSIVTGFNSSKSPDGTVTSSPEVTAIPFGPVLDIVPNVSPDGYSIQMTVTATVTEFLGYDQPAPAVKDTWEKVSKDAIPLPTIRTRQVTTSAAVWDGQTLVLGGLMSENVVKVKDKVPVLGDVPLVGRLFRHEARTTQKKNLLIFVTPTLIDPAGNRVHPEESLRSQRTIPPQK